MSFRVFALLVIAASSAAIIYVMSGNERVELKETAGPNRDMVRINRTATNHKVGTLLSTDFNFHNQQGRTIVLTEIRPCCIGTEVKTDAKFPIEMAADEKIAFTVSVTPGPNDYGSATAAYAYWKYPDSTEVQSETFRVDFHCTHEWIVEPLKFDLGTLPKGQSVSPCEIQLKRLKGSQWNAADLRIECNARVHAKVDELPNPVDIKPQTPIEREHYATISVQLPTPDRTGGFAHAITLHDEANDRVEVIQFVGVVRLETTTNEQTN